jgi:hypothetical protein
MSIYIIKLSNEKYFICKKQIPNMSFEELVCTGFNFDWTTLNKPLQIIQRIDNCNDFDEDKYTLIYMKRYGINNVRGGNFIDVELDQQIVFVIENIIKNQEEKNSLEIYQTYDVPKLQTEINNLEQKRQKIVEYNQFINQYKYIVTPTDEDKIEINTINIIKLCVKTNNNIFCEYIEKINDPKFNFSSLSTIVEKAFKICITIKNYEKELLTIMKSIDDNCNNVIKAIKISSSRIELMYQIYASKI